MGIPVIDLRLEDGKLSVGSKEELHVVIEEDIILDPHKLGYNYVDFTGNLGLGMWFLRVTGKCDDSIYFNVLTKSIFQVPHCHWKKHEFDKEII